MFRGTRVLAPVFSMLAGLGAETIVRHDYRSLSTAEIEGALQLTCRLLERCAPSENG